MMRHLLILATTALIAAPVAAADFYPITSASSSTDATDLWPVSNLIQGPGVGFDANAPNDKLVGGADGNWVTADPGGFPSDYIEVAGAPVLMFDLGQDQSLSEISVWGYAATNTNGVSSYSLRFGTDAEGAGGVGSSITYNPTFSATIDDTIRQSSLFSETVSARFVELTALDNYFVAPGDGSGGELAGGDRVGLGEVAFAVPEPSSLSLLAIGLLAFVRRRR